jgi:hypothetical protein
MTERKNVTLKDPYDEMFQDLKARREFQRSFGSFSEFVQAMIEEFHRDPDKVRAQYHQRKVERHKKLKQNYEELSDSDMEKESEELEEQEQEFFQEFYELLKEKKGTRKWHQNKMKTYKNFEDGWIRKYQKQFGSIREKEFRKKIEKYIGQEKLEDLGLVGEIEA